MEEAQVIKCAKLGTVSNKVFQPYGPDRAFKDYRKEEKLEESQRLTKQKFY